MEKSKTTLSLPVLPFSAIDIVNKTMDQDCRVMLFGSPGIGKSNLTAQLASALTKQGRVAWCLSADPGSPAIGIPGAISLGKWEKHSWEVMNFEALCTLDAGRFRLPLILAVKRLAQLPQNGVVLLDGPGVVRGVAGRELLVGLTEAAGIDKVLALSFPNKPLPLADELQALAKEVYVINALEDARRPGKKVRGRQRTAQWDAYLQHTRLQKTHDQTILITLDLSQGNTAPHLIGTPPPLEATSAWTGRQVGFLQSNTTVAMGEVLRFHNQILSVRVPDKKITFDTLCIRDALRTTEGVIETATPFAAEQLEYLPPVAGHAPGGLRGGPRVMGRVGVVDVNLINGVFGDPLLHLRLRHQRRSLLFDLGMGGRLPARIAHQVTDIFISHAHMDHIGGFLWFLRSRIGELPVCRLYGPPGLADHIAGFIQSILWDRLTDNAPCFEVTEVHNTTAHHFRFRVGQPGREFLEQKPIVDGILLEERGFRVRTVILDHRYTSVLAFAFESGQEMNIRKDRLQARKLTPGPWLSRLKQELMAGNQTTLIQLPNNQQATVAELADDLVLTQPGKKLVYATDLADTGENRQSLTELAKGAHTFFCEATFTQKELEQASRTGHLTAQACGEIATAAGVTRLMPFHFSHRYDDDPQPIYEEIEQVCAQLVKPKSMKIFEAEESLQQEEVLVLV
jgi:ribonuclease Z